MAKRRNYSKTDVQRKSYNKRRREARKAARDSAFVNNPLNRGGAELYLKLAHGEIWENFQNGRAYQEKEITGYLKNNIGKPSTQSFTKKGKGFSKYLSEKTMSANFQRNIMQFINSGHIPKERYALESNEVKKQMNENPKVKTLADFANEYRFERQAGKGNVFESVKKEKERMERRKAELEDIQTRKSLTREEEEELEDVSQEYGIVYESGKYIVKWGDEKFEVGSYSFKNTARENLEGNMWQSVDDDGMPF
jgi:hypothetical protein